VTQTVAFILKGYPRLSETFIAEEIGALEQVGLEIRIISLRHPTDHATHPVHGEIRAPVNYLPEYLHQEPLRVIRAWWKLRARPGYAETMRTWLADLHRDPTLNRVRRFGQALVLASELPQAVKRLHAHFLHTPASVARYASLLTDLPWSCSAHAKDIWTIPEWEKREKLAACDWLVSCTAINCQHLRTLAAEPDNVKLIYHGLNFDRFPLSPEGIAPKLNASRSQSPVVILSVGRLVAKKGYGDLLDALAQLARSPSWRFVHVGAGPLLKSLQRQAHELNIAEQVTWLGALTQAQVLDQYRRADIFVLACRIAQSGDRDGLPNVLLEAQSQGLPCVSTNVSGVPELIEDGSTGVLVEAGDVDALAEALARLIGDPHLRLALGEAGMQRTKQQFSLQSGIARLAKQFGIPPEDIAKAPVAHGQH
jgi:glycosyltransferase involved in cell wall biosynthesis